MFQRELSILALVRQYNLLGEILNEFEDTGPFDRRGRERYVNLTAEVARNLARFREIQQDYSRDLRGLSRAAKRNFTHSLHEHPQKIITEHDNLPQS